MGAGIPERSLALELQVYGLGPDEFRAEAFTAFNRESWLLDIMIGTQVSAGLAFSLFLDFLGWDPGLCPDCDFLLPSPVFHTQKVRLHRRIDLRHQGTMLKRAVEP